MNRSKAHKKKKREEAEWRQERFRQSDAGKAKYGVKKEPKKTS